MSNIKLILTENKATPYRKQRVVGRLGDGGLTTIDVELLQSDGKTPYAVFSNHELIFVGTNAKGEYTDGVPEILDGQKGIIRYTFTKENFSVLKEFKRAYFQLTDAEGSRVTFQDFTVDVLNNSDIDQGQVTLYVRLLDQLLADFEKRFGNQSVDFEERFKVFLQAKDLQYQNIYQMYNDLVIKLDKLSKDTKSIQEMQAEILKSIEEHDVFTKQESSANVIDNIAGTEKAILKNGLLIDGISGTGARDDNGTLIPFVQDDYYKLASTDTYVRNETLVSGRGAEIQFDFNVIETLESRYPAIFESSTTIAEKISKYKTIIKNVNANIIIRGRGIHSSTNVATNFSRLFLSWGTNYSNNTSLGIASSSDFSKINSNLSVLGINSISNKGYYTLFAVTRRTGASDNGAVSDGVTPAWVEVKDISLTVELEVNGRTIIESMIAANHIENIATEEEAEAGENNEKTMTPLRVFQAIAKWTKDKFVSRTENETVLGVKNFANGLQVGGNNVLTQNGEIRFVTNSTNNSSLESGSIVFKRYGDDVDIYANFQVRASGDLTRDMNIVAESIVDDIFEPGENFSFFVGNETAQAVVKFVGKGIKAHSTLTKGIWYVGTASYKAKNKL